MKTNRIQEITKILLQQEKYLTIQTLSNQLNVSQRTIHNDLASVDFKDFIYPAVLSKKPNKGIKLLLSHDVKVQLHKKIKNSIDIKNNKEDDFSNIMLKLLCQNEPITIDDLADELFISSSSLYPLLNKISDYSNEFSCKLTHKKGKGYFLEGNEINIRELFYAFITNLLKLDEVSLSYPRINSKTEEILTYFLLEKEYNSLIHILKISEDMINTNYVDEDYNQLLVQLTILILRVREDRTINDSSLNGLLNTQEYYCATLIKTYIEKDFILSLNEYEICYITSLLLGTRKQINIINSNQNLEALEKFINLLSIRLNVELSYDFELKQNLINHLKPAIHRIKHGIVSKNPLLEQIRINFTEIYMAVITTIEDLEHMEQIFFDSNEIGYICLHIIAAINRPSNKKKTRVALICNEGLSIEIFLKNIIESYFKEINVSDIFRENTYSNINVEDYEIVLNTTTRNIQGKNVINISTNFTQQDHAIIRHYLTQLTTGVIKTEDLYSHYMLFFKDNSKDQNELLTKYCQFLLDGNYVKSDFYESVIKRINISSTYIARGIALPHGAKEQVINSVILMIKLENSIIWDNEETDFVILVAANDADAKDYSYLFRKIMKIAACDSLSMQLKNCHNINDLTELLDRV